MLAVEVRPRAEHGHEPAGQQRLHDLGVVIVERDATAADPGASTDSCRRMLPYSCL